MDKEPQIIITIGPSTRSEEVISQLLDHHMSIARLNFSWGTHEEHAGYIETVRKVAQEHNLKVPVFIDLSGPRENTEEGHQFNQSSQGVLTEKDIKDVIFGIEKKIDYFALSYVGTAQDVKDLKKTIASHGASTPVIAKIERVKAFEHIDEIIEAADAVMVARGDMGNEFPLEEIPFVQRKIIEKCQAAGKPVITATQMLFSMRDNPKPTRAEVTDAVFALMCGSDVLMLSDETTTGKYPVEAVEILEKVIKACDKYLKPRSVHQLKVLG